jgi:hypothetical protein
MRQQSWRTCFLTTGARSSIETAIARLIRYPLLSRTMGPLGCGS